MKEVVFLLSAIFFASCSRTNRVTFDSSAVDNLKTDFTPTVVIKSDIDNCIYPINMEVLDLFWWYKILGETNLYNCTVSRENICLAL